MKSYISIIFASTLLLSTFALSSCSTLFGSSKKSTEKPPVSAEATTPENTVAKTVFTPEKIKEQLSGEWQIIKAGTAELPLKEDMPYVNFDTTEGNFYASNGCNILNGNFTISGKTISFANVLSTMRSCPDIENQQDIDRILADGCTFNLHLEYAESDNFYFLILQDNRGTNKLTLRRSDMRFINGQWQVSQIGENTYNDPEMNIFFDIPERKVHGNTGCNYFNGEIYTDPTVGGSLNFGQLGVTRMACPDKSAETAMLVALEQVCAARQASEGTVTLHDHNGTTLMVLKAVSPTTKE